jgi:hypothetical protein
VPVFAAALAAVIRQAKGHFFSAIQNPPLGKAQVPIFEHLSIRAGQEVSFSEKSHRGPYKKNGRTLFL